MPTLIVLIPSRSDVRRKSILSKNAGCLLLLLLLSLAPWLSGCGGEKQAPPRTARPAGPMRVTLTKAQERNISLETSMTRRMEIIDWVRCNGEIQAADPLTVQVFSPAPGRITRLAVSLGQSVGQGQLLATVKSDEVGRLESEMLQQMLENDAELRQANVQLELSRAAYERERELLKEEVSAKADFESARAQYKKDLVAIASIRTKNAAAIQSFRERLSLYGVGNDTVTHVIRSRRIFPYLFIRAPHSGIITERKANPGEILDTGKTLLTISDLDEVWLVGNVYEKDIAKVKMDQPIRVEVDSLPERHFTGNINFISNLLDPQSRTLPVRGMLANPNLALKPNMFARMSIEAGRYRALAVPQSAIQMIGDRQVVYVMIAPHIYEERTILPGRQHEQYIEINSGLSEGETIATAGTVGLKGMIIRKRGEIASGGAGS